VAEVCIMIDFRFGLKEVGRIRALGNRYLGIAG
jgi:hypothetical protein